MNGAEQARLGENGRENERKNEKPTTIGTRERKEGDTRELEPKENTRTEFLGAQDRAR